MKVQCEYDVVFSKGLSDLIECVNRTIVTGWEPIGGISTKLDSSSTTYYQAVVRWRVEHKND